MNQDSRFFVRIALAAAAVALVGAIGLLLYQGRLILLLSLVGVGLGSLASPLLTRLQDKWGLPRALSAFLGLLAGSLLLLLVGVLWGVMVVEQVDHLGREFPQLLENLQGRLQDFGERYPWAEKQLQKLDMEDLFQAITQRLAQGMRSGLALVSGLIFIIVVALYTAIHAREYAQGLVRFFPAPGRSRVLEVLRAMGQTLRRWFRAQITDMLLVGALTLSGLWLVGAQYWALLGLLTALLCFIPYLGMILVVGLAGLITVASNPAQLPWVLGVFLITQIIEGNLILPRLMKKQVELPEMPLLLFILLMGTWAGLLGIFMAPPLFAVGKTLLGELYFPRVDE